MFDNLPEEVGCENNQLCNSFERAMAGKTYPGMMGTLGERKRVERD